MGEGCVNKVSKKGRWKKDDPFVFWHSGGEQIRAMREGIRSCKVGSQDMNHGEVKIC